ncbi:MAG: hypothetical protein ABIO16_13575 [Nocardioides sp.]
MTDHDQDELMARRRDERLRQEIRRSKGLLDLLDKRPELREVCALAELTGERLLWTA